MSKTQFSHSRVSTFNKCPAQYKHRYIDKLKTIHDPAPDDSLIIGNALHLGIEKDEKAMLEAYFGQFTVIDDLQVNESIKLISGLRKVKEFLNTLPGELQHEYRIDRPGFTGIVDLLVHTSNGVDIYDFKYSNNVKNYLESEQLHLYKFYLEILGFNVNRLGYIFIPKTSIRQKKTEDLYQFRKRLKETLAGMEIDVRYVDYDPAKMERFFNSTHAILTETEFPKNQTHLCDWCEFKSYCLEGEDWMILPSSERRQIGAVKRKTLWIYGAPFSGKTWFVNKFPAPLMLNTDGNIDFVDAPFIPIRDEVTVEGRITKRKLAWEVFKDTVVELEKKQNDFQTIIVDLLEDTYEHCRIYMYDKLSIEHESDNSFKAWDMVRTEFLSTLKRLLNLPYDVILISHEDTSKDFTKKTGDKVTRIAPNIQEKTANKIAGMVQLVARVVSDDDERWLTFKTSEVEFGGGRLGIKSRKIPLEYEEFVKLYEEVNDGKSEQVIKPSKEESADSQIEDKPPWESEQDKEQSENEQPAEEPQTDEKPRRRTRKSN